MRLRLSTKTGPSLELNQVIFIDSRTFLACLKITVYLPEISFSLNIMKLTLLVLLFFDCKKFAWYLVDYFHKMYWKFNQIDIILYLILQKKSRQIPALRYYWHTYFYTHSIEARICLGFSSIQPQNMLKICLPMNIQKRKFHILTHAWWRESVEGIKMKKFWTLYPLEC